MPNQFDHQIPAWNSQNNQGAGLEVADLSGTGKKDLIIFQINSLQGANQGLYKIGKNLDPAGVILGGWTNWLNVPDWQSWENQGGDVAVADLSGTGEKDLIVFQIDNPPQLNRGLYKIGRNMDSNGAIAGSWTGWIEIPDWGSWENQGGAIAAADLTGTGKNDLIVFQIDNPPRLNQGRYKIGRNMDSNGVVAGGWTGWIEVPNWFSFDNAGAGVAITELDNSGSKNIIVFQVDNAATQNQGFFKIGRQIDVNGNVNGGWLPWYGVPSWMYWENAGAGIAVANLTGASSHEMVVLAVDNPPKQAENLSSYQVLPLDNDPKTQGSWELLPYKSEVLPVHAALLPNGKVLFAAGSGNNGVRFNNPDLGDVNKKIYCSVVWDYAASTPALPLFSHPNTLRDGNGKVLDLFCGGETLLSDGRLLAAGGTQTYDVDAAGNLNGRPFTGSRAIMTFDAGASTDPWKRQADMSDGRWYPTLVSLSNGKVLIAAGLDRNGNPNRSIEIFAPDAGIGKVSTLPLPPPEQFSVLPAYPHLIQMQDGTIFFTGGRMDDRDTTLLPCLLNITQNPIGVKKVEKLQFPQSRNQSTSVLLPPAQAQRVMIFGGAPPEGEENATDSVNVIDLSNPATAQYQVAPSLLLPRVHLNAVILPDRTLFVCGGALQREGGEAGERKITARFQSEIYDPQTNTWRLGATAKVERMYHSIALLLPDGKVVAASGNPDKGRVPNWQEDPNEERSLEIYSPPYLFQGARPLIGIVKTEWKYGETIAIASPQAGSMLWGSLIRSGVVTHSFNTDQRLVDLPIISQVDGVVRVTVTNNPNLAPPGWYMLFLTDNNRIPSVSKWIHLT